VRPPEPSAPDFTVSVEFRGGTVGQYIDTIKAAAKDHAVNVVASRAAMEVQIGPISLRDVSVYTALSAIRSAAGRDTQWAVDRLVSPGGKTVEAYALEFQPQLPGPTRVSSTDVGISVFSLRDLVEPLPGDPAGVQLVKPPEVVLTAVKAALDLMGDRGNPDMKFHEDSGLLIIHGNAEQTNAVRQALDQIRDDIGRRRSAAKATATPQVDYDSLQAELKKRQVLRNQALRDLERGDTELQRMRKMVEAGQASGNELPAVEAKLDEARSRVEMTDIEIDRIQKVLKAADQAGGPQPEQGPAAGKSVAVYDLPPVDAKAREQLISSIRSLEAAINNPEKLRIQSVQGESKLVIEADGAMHGVVRGMVKEMAGARTDNTAKPKGRAPDPRTGR
jgi:hypothetical protein